MGWRGITPDQVNAMPYWIRKKVPIFAAEWEKMMRGGK